MYSFNKDGSHLASSHQNVHVHNLTNELEERNEDIINNSSELNQNEEEPAHALDLRIIKATESISIFKAQNVLEYTSSTFGPASPRPGQVSISPTFYAKRSQRCKNLVKSSVSFCVFGIFARRSCA
jgi:hypothetical protein